MSATAQVSHTAAWTPAAAAVFLAALQWPLLDIYALVHWGALHSSAVELPKEFQSPLLHVLSILVLWRALIGAVGFVFGVRSIFLRPRWVGVIGVLAGVIGAFIGLAVQM